MSLAEDPQERIETARPLMLASIPVPRLHVQWLARQLDGHPTGERLRTALELETPLLGLSIEERHAILRALEDCPEPLAELRATLLAEHIGRQAIGL